MDLGHLVGGGKHSPSESITRKLPGWGVRGILEARAHLKFWQEGMKWAIVREKRGLWYLGGNTKTKT